VTNTTGSSSVPSAASGDPSLTPGEIAGAADSTELVFINSVEHSVSVDEPRPAKEYHSARIFVDGAPTLRLMGEALHAFRVAKVPPDAIIQFGGNLVMATWQREL
jgi:hypothetical protein